METYNLIKCNWWTWSKGRKVETLQTFHFHKNKESLTVIVLTLTTMFTTPECNGLKGLNDGCIKVNIQNIKPTEERKAECQEIFDVSKQCTHAIDLCMTCIMHLIGLQ